MQNLTATPPSTALKAQTKYFPLKNNNISWLRNTQFCGVFQCLLAGSSHLLHRPRRFVIEGVVRDNKALRREYKVAHMAKIPSGVIRESYVHHTGVDRAISAGTKHLPVLSLRRSHQGGSNQWMNIVCV